jgi:hypothetical protein
MPRRADDYDDEDDDREIRARRRRPPRRYDDDDDAEDYVDDEDDDAPSVGAKIIPYRNGWALAAYYVAFLSAILVLVSLVLAVAVTGDSLPKGFMPVAVGVAVFGIVLGPVAAILGFLGMRYSRAHRQAAGGGHAVIGIIIGALSALIGILVLVGVAVFAFRM